MKTYCLIGVLLFFAACAQTKNHQSLVGRTPQSIYEFVDEIPVLNESIRSSELNPVSCVPFIEGHTSNVYERPSGFYFPKNQAEKSYLETHQEASLKGLFDLRLGLREFVRKYPTELSEECLGLVRRAIRYARFAEDSLAEWLFFNSANAEAVPAENFGGGYLHTLLNPKFDKVDFMPGDVLLVRGQSSVSAMIARIGDEDAQFSHMALVGKDSSGKLHVIEALIETGVIITPLETYMKEKEARIALFRNPDEALALRAGRRFYDYASEKLARGEVIPYDFGMEPDDHSQIFCSEVVRYAYKLASNDAYKVPLYLTSIARLSDTDFIRGLGVTARQTFAPADIELDHRFEVVAEFRTIPRLRRVRMQDSILTSIYSWIETKGSKFKFSPAAKAKARAAWALRQLGFARDKLQKHMRPSTLETVFLFQSLSESLEKHLFATEEAYFQRQGHSMTFKDLLHVNEEFRRKDCEAHKLNLQKQHEADFIPVPVEFHNSFRMSHRDSCNLE
jgi:hypothetical protein